MRLLLFPRVAIALLAGSFSGSLPALAAPSSTIAISQVYGGGGNSGATYKNDFIEIFNLSAGSISLNGMSVQYASSSGTSWSVTNLSGTLAPGGYYLVQEAAGAAGTTSLPTPDATGSLNLSASAGKVALVNSTTAISGACPTAGVIDLLGFGTATNCSETSPTANLSNTTAAIRAGSGCTDTDNNSTDFSTTAAPTPRNSATAAHACSGGQQLTITASSLPAATQNVFYSATVSASGGSGTRAWTATSLPASLSIDSSSGVISGVPTASPATYNVTITVADDTGSAQSTFPLVVSPPSSCGGAILIGQIQGSGDASPLAGQTVTTSGIVTGIRGNGFFIQSPPPGDNDSATSDGIFIFTSSAPTGAAALQNLVCVSGVVAEFQGQTEIASPSVIGLASSQSLPAPYVLTSADLDPNGGVDQLEKYSGMRVEVQSMTVTGPTFGSVNETNATATSNGQFYGVLTGVARPFRLPGIALTDTLPPGTPPNVPRWNGNPQVIEVYGAGLIGATPIDVTTGATVTNLTGVLSYFPSQYEILPDPSGTPTVSGNISYTAIPEKTSGEITVASANLEHFYNTRQDPNGSGIVTVLTPTAFANRLNKVSLGFRKVLRLPDVIAVEELEDLDTLQTLAAKVNSDAAAATGTNPDYHAYLAEGNDISNINVGFLVKSSITVVDVTQYGKDTTFVSPTSGSTLLLNDRPPLILRARASRPGSSGTMAFTVIVNHLRSLNGIDDPSSGAQVRDKRLKQAEYLADLIQSRQAADPNEKIIAVGDFNAYQFNDGYVDSIGAIKGTPTPADEVVLASNALVNPTLTALVDLDAPQDRYSYTFSGSAEELDQILVNPTALGVYSRYAVGRVDADFPEVYRNDPNRPERVSDHDWPVVYLSLPPEAAPANSDVSGQVSITSTGLTYSRLGKQYSGTLTVTNTSASAINAPLQLVLANLSSGASLANATGTAAQGPYISAMPGGTLAAGASVQVAVRILAPPTASPTFTPMVYSGTF